MFRIIIQREKEYQGIKKPNNKKVEDSTVGTLNIYDSEGKSIFNCYTLENGGDSSDISGQDKRIVARDYNIEFSPTTVSLPKEYKGKGLLLTCDNEIKSFRYRRILIHIGNYPQDSEGCILLGFTNNNNGMILRSTEAVKQFYDVVKKYGADNFILTIKEISK